MLCKWQNQFAQLKLQLWWSERVCLKKKKKKGQRDGECVVCVCTCLLEFVCRWERQMRGGGDGERQVWKGRDLETDESLSTKRRSAASISARVCVAIFAMYSTPDKSSATAHLFPFKNCMGSDHFHPAAMATWSVRMQGRCRSSAEDTHSTLVYQVKW